MSSTSDISREVDPAVIRRIAEGDTQAFDELYTQLSGLLFSVAFRMLQRHEEAEELLQEVFVKIWKDAATYDPRRGAPVAWALTITRHKAIDRIRSNSRRLRLNEESGIETELRETTPASQPSDEVELSETAAAVQSSLNQLPHEVRQTVELAYFGGLAQSQIAEKLSVPLSTVKSHIRRAMLQLRHSLRDFT